MKSSSWSRISAFIFCSMVGISGGLVAQEQTAQAKPVQHHHYAVIDMGTFGGPASFFVLALNAHPWINSRGTAVGGSTNATPTSAQSNPFVCGGGAGILQNLNHAFRYQAGAVNDLGALAPSGENCSVANANNAKGDIVGTSENGVLDPVTGFNELRAVLWKGGRLKDLGTFGGNLSVAGGINDSGQVAGEALNDIADPYSLFDLLIFGSSTGTQTRAFIWKNGVKQDLGTLGGPDAAAGFGWGFINQRGQVAGFSYTNATPNAATGIPTLDPFLWKNGHMQDLGTFGGVYGFVTALNNRGQVIGGSSLGGADEGACLIFGFSSGCHPFLWDRGKLIDLRTSTRGGTPVTADLINDAGEIVGGAGFPNVVYDAYLWRNGTAIDLGNLGDPASEVDYVNSRGQAVGGTFTNTGVNLRAILWEKGSMIDLNTVIPAGSSLYLKFADTINDAGEIGGVGVPAGCTDKDACGHAFVLIPCDENHPGVKGCDYSPVIAETPGQPGENHPSH
jgi:probable HAF family extracellular repeat protein